MKKMTSICIGKSISVVHLAMALALSAMHPSLAANATNAINATADHSVELELDLDAMECPQPDRQVCAGTPFAVLRDPTNNCTFYDCPPAPPGYVDWTVESSSSIGDIGNSEVDEQQQQQQPPEETTTTTTTTTNTSPPPICAICTNIPTANMLSRDFDCTTAIQALATRCADDTGWVAGSICQSSCYFAGRGYDGDVCCPGNTGYPTMSPTVSPSEMPTTIPSKNGTAAVNENNDINGTADDGGEKKIVCDSPFGPKKAGELYFTSDGCNYCVCGDDGESACTALVCPGTPTSSSSLPPAASPTASPTGIVCPTDVLECGSNITLARDPSAGCEFGPAATCPPTTLPPGTSYKCAESSTGIYPVDMCLGFIWCQDGDYLAGPSLCPSGKRFDGSCQCCKGADEVNCEVGFGRSRHLMKGREGSGLKKKGRNYYLRR